MTLEEASTTCFVPFLSNVASGRLGLQNRRDVYHAVHLVLANACLVAFGGAVLADPAAAAAAFSKLVSVRKLYRGICQSICRHLRCLIPIAGSKG